MNEIVVFSFTKKGHALANRILENYPKARHVKEYKTKKLSLWVEEAFCQHSLLIFVGAMGIGVRSIAPFVRGKDVDPAVIVVDELGQYVIPVLSGHLGGANEYSQELGRMLQATPVITTATDVNKVFAVDTWAKKSDLFIHNIEEIKSVSATLLEGRKIGLCSEYPVSCIPDFVDLELEENLEAGILIADEYKGIYQHTLWISPKKYVLGVGCRKAIDVDQFERQLLEFLKDQNIPLDLVSCVASIDLKGEEEGILRFVQKYGLGFQTFTRSELEQVEGDFSGSDFVRSVTGVDNVCERSAVLASGAEELLIKKTIASGMTIAVCIRPWVVEPMTIENRR